MYEWHLRMTETLPKERLRRSTCLQIPKLFMFKLHPKPKTPNRRTSKARCLKAYAPFLVLSLHVFGLRGFREPSTQSKSWAGHSPEGNSWSPTTPGPPSRGPCYSVFFMLNFIVLGCIVLLLYLYLYLCLCLYLYLYLYYTC